MRINIGDYMKSEDFFFDGVSYKFYKMVPEEVDISEYLYRIDKMELNMKDFDIYQKEARKTAIYPNIGNNITYPALGLAGETGEVCEKIKKIFRDKNGVLGQEDRDALEKEIGDILWYISALSSECNLSLASIASKNLEKLKSRQERGKLSGSGDNR